MTNSNLGKWPASIDIPVAWGDMDVLGHVNNVVYARWFESGRAFYFDRLGFTQALNDRGVAPILARQEINYRLSTSYPDTVQVKTTVSHIGNTSFTMAFEIWSQQQQKLIAEGSGVLVMVDYGRGQKVTVSDELRRAIYEFEGTQPNR